MWHGAERRRNAFTDEQFEEIADRVAFKVADRLADPLAEQLASQLSTNLKQEFYQALGKWTFERLLLLGGAVCGLFYLLLPYFKT